MFARPCTITIPLVDQRNETHKLHMVIAIVKSGLIPAICRYVSNTILHIVVNDLQRLVRRDQWEIPVL